MTRPRMSRSTLLAIAFAILALVESSNAHFPPNDPQGQLPFMTIRNNRLMSFAGKSQRDIVVTFVKNISEAVPVGELLANFRAEDRESATYNLT